MLKNPMKKNNDDQFAIHLQKCEEMTQQLRSQIKELQSSTTTHLLTHLAGNKKVLEYTPQQRREFSAHFQKIHALDWFPNSDRLISVSQDGLLLFWNSITAKKISKITLKTAWVMTCCVSNLNTGDYVASGGLDNIISGYFSDSSQRSNSNSSQDPKFTLEGHGGYISCSKFLYSNDNNLISSSGDATCILWDIQRKKIKSTFIEHKLDVMSIDIDKWDNKNNIFVSGSVDGTAKIWDIRMKDNKCVINFNAHDCDINTVKWFPEAKAVLTGSDDGMVKLFDMRSLKQLNEYYEGVGTNFDPRDYVPTVTSVDVSKSGQFIFIGCEDGNVAMWSTINGVKIADLSHDSKVSDISVSPDGYALATACWDFIMRTFA